MPVFLGLGDHIEGSHHRNAKNHERIADSDNLWVFISKDKGDEVAKYHEIKENDKDLIPDTIGLAPFVFVKGGQKCRICV